MPKNSGKSSLQGAGKKLLKSATGGGGSKAIKNKAVAVAAGSAKSIKSRKEMDKKIAALRERQSAKSFKKRPTPKVVLAAPIFDLPSERDLLLQPQAHPMDAFLLGEQDERRPRHATQAPASAAAVISSSNTTDGNRFEPLEQQPIASLPFQIVLQPSILFVKPAFIAVDDPDL